MLKSFFGGKSTACMSDYLGLQTTKRRGVSCNALYKCTTLKLTMFQLRGWGRPLANAWALGLRAVLLFVCLSAFVRRL